MTQIKKFIVNSFQVNSYIIYDDTNEAVIIDGATSNQQEEKLIIDFVKDNNLNIKYIINTHAHVDHVCGNYFLKTNFNSPIVMNFNDIKLLDLFEYHAILFSLSKINKPPNPDIDAKDQNLIKFGNTELKVIHTPGHTQGCICLYCEKENFLMTGDTIFKSSIGRTDLEGGNFEQLINSITTQIIVLPKKTIIYPGHGESTSVKDEIQKNPFIR